MAKDERYHKQQQQSLFYLALKHQHHDQFEAMLEPHERALWASIPVFHQAFIQHFRDWEWLVKQSFDLLHGHSMTAESVRVTWWHYQELAKTPKPTLYLSDLATLLHPLHYLPDDDLWQCIDEVMVTQASIAQPYQPSSFADSKLKLLNHVISLEWLQSQSFDHLKQCAQVWSGYLALNQSAHEPVNTSIQGNLDRQLEFIKSELLEHVHQKDLNIMRLPRGFKASFRQWFCSRYLISQDVFNKRWQELLNEGFLDSSFKPNHSKK